MADSEATLALGIDSSGVQAGAQTFVRAASDIQGAANATAAQQERLNALLQQSGSAYAGATGAADMLADAQYRATLATTAEQDAFDALIGPASAAALAHQALAESADVAAVSVAEAADAAETSGASFTLGGYGATYMARSLDMLALSSIGATGGVGRAAAAVGVFGLGAGPSILIIAGIAAIVGGIELLTSKGDDAVSSAQQLVDQLTKAAAVRFDNAHPLDVYNTKIQTLTASTLELQVELQKALNPPPVAQGALMPGSTAGVVDVATVDKIKLQIDQNNADATEAAAQYTDQINKGAAAQTAADEAAAARAAALFQQRQTELHTLADMQSDAAIAQARSDGDAGALDAALTAKAIADLQVRVQGMSQLTQGERDLATASGMVVINQESVNRLLADSADLMAPVLAAQQAEAAQLSAQASQQDTLNKAVADAAVSQAKMDGDDAQAQMLTHQNALEAINNQVAAMTTLNSAQQDQYRQALLTNLAYSEMPKAVTETASTVSTAYNQLSHQIEQSLSTAFDNVAQHGLASFSGFFTDVESLFTKLVSDMAAKWAAAKIFDTGGSVADDAAAVSSGAGGANYGNTGVPFGQVANADAGATSWDVPAVAFTAAIAGVVSSMVSSAAESKAAAAALAAAQTTWAATLQQYVDSTSLTVSALQKQVDTANANAQALKDKAASTFGIGGATASGLEAMDPAQLQQELNEKWVQSIPALQSFIQALLQIEPATRAAQVAITTQLVTAIQAAYTASLPGGNNLTTLQGYGTQEGNAYASLNTGLANGTLSPTDYATEFQEATQTFSNQWHTFLGSLSLSDLSTLLPELTGDQYAYAQSLITTDRATEDAANGNALAIRTAQDAGNDYLVKVLQDSNEYAADVAAGWSAADLATLKNIQSTEEQTVATNDATTAATNLANAFDTFVSNAEAGASAAGDMAGSYAFNILQTQKTIEGWEDTATAAYKAGQITQQMYNEVMTDFSIDWTNALNSVTGTIQDVATAAQILSDNASQLTQEFSIFGTSLADQASTMRSLYGFTGLTDDQIRAQYTPEQNGVDLTPAQKTLDDNIASYFAVENTYLNSLQSTANATQTTTTAAVGTTSLTGAAAAVPVASQSIVTGPNYFTFNITADKTTLTDPSAFVSAVMPVMDAELKRRASLYSAAAGQQP